MFRIEVFPTIIRFVNSLCTFFHSQCIFLNFSFLFPILCHHLLLIWLIFLSCILYYIFIYGRSQREWVAMGSSECIFNIHIVKSNHSHEANKNRKWRPTITTTVEVAEAKVKATKNDDVDMNVVVLVVVVVAVVDNDGIKMSALCIANVTH